jgi:hypothetical protein
MYFPMTGIAAFYTPRQRASGIDVMTVCRNDSGSFFCSCNHGAGRLIIRPSAHGYSLRTYIVRDYNCSNTPINKQSQTLLIIVKNGGIFKKNTSCQDMRRFIYAGAGFRHKINKKRKHKMNV